VKGQGAFLDCPQRQGSGAQHHSVNFKSGVADLRFRTPEPKDNDRTAGFEKLVAAHAVSASRAGVGFGLPGSGLQVPRVLAKESARPWSSQTSRNLGSTGRGTSFLELTNGSIELRHAGSDGNVHPIEA
jgi:hypothetical protein